MPAATVKIVDSANGSVLAEKAVVAAGFFERMKGLLGTEKLDEGGGLVLDPCTSIHTFFMKYPIDAVVLDGEDRVIAVYGSLRPFRISRIHPAARRFVELPAGTIEKTRVREGDRLVFEESR